METSKYNGVEYLKRKAQLLQNIENNKIKLKKLEKENKKENFKWIQEINKIYDEDITVTMMQLANKYDTSYFKINRNIWHPRASNRPRSADE